jgi:hypothetical protein
MSTLVITEYDDRVFVIERHEGSRPPSRARSVGLRLIAPQLTGMGR